MEGENGAAVEGWNDGAKVGRIEDGGWSIWVESSGRGGSGVKWEG